MALDAPHVDAVAEEIDHSSAHARPQLGTLTRSRPDAASRLRLLSCLAWAVVLLAIIAFNHYAIEQLRVRDGRLMTRVMGRENGQLEIAQLMALVPAIALFSFAGLRGLGAVRVAGAILAMIGTIALIREVDLDNLRSSIALFDWLLAYKLPDVLAAFFGLAVVLYLFLQRRYFGGLLRLGLRWQAWPCLASVFLLVTGQFYIEGLPAHSDVHFWDLRFWEELVEANGYFLFALAAWQHSRLIGDPEFDSPIEARG